MNEVRYVFEVQSQKDAADPYTAVHEEMLENVSANYVYRTREEAASRLQALVPSGRNPVEYGNYRIEEVPYNSFHHCLRGAK